MATRRFRAPRADGEVLADPTSQLIPALIAKNQTRLNSSEMPFGHASIGSFRRQIRTQIYALLAAKTKKTLDPEKPLVMSGHQPELFHPGVWVKNFALSSHASAVDGLSLYIIVDNDAVKSTTLRLPVWEQWKPEQIQLGSLRIDSYPWRLPYELAPIQDLRLFASTANRLVRMTENWPFTPILQSLWQRVTHQESSLLVDHLIDFRKYVEYKWGIENLELRVSELCEIEGWRQFLETILSDLPRFHTCYNQALAQYRLDNQLQSKNHPAPDLARERDWYEAPFWSWSAQNSRRSPVFFQHGSRPTLRAAGVEIPCHDWDQAWKAIRQRGVRIRPRALTLTLFMRVFLGDLFIHGIGGGKYDEVTDLIIHNYLGIEPPGFQVLSATLHLPVPKFPATHEHWQHQHRLERDLRWNPQRYLTQDQADWISRHQQLIASPTDDRLARRKRNRELRELRRRLGPLVETQRLEAEMNAARLRAELNANQLLRRRDFSWVLYPEPMLRDFMKRFIGSRGH